MQDERHDRYEDELAAYMLGALTDEEAGVFEAHLAGCRQCQARERWLRASVELLPSSVEQFEPPPALRERLLDEVRQEAGVPQEAARPRPASRPERRGHAGWFGALSLRPAAALAAVALVLAAGIAGYAIRGTDSGSQRISATGTPAAPQTTGTVVKNGDSGVLQVANLPQRRGRVYEVWLVKGGKPVPAALFQVNRDGTGSAGIPSGLDDSTQLMVTSEPAGGSDQPTTKPLLSAPI